MKTFKTLLLVITIIATYTLNAQVAVTTDGSSADGSAMLDVKSTTKGLLPPRMTETQRDAITPTAGLMVYNTTTNMPNYYNGTYWMRYDGNVAEILNIGDSYGGGKVAYIYQVGDPGYVGGETHGLITATVDVGFGINIQWYNGSNVYTGVAAASLGTGGTNTTRIISYQGETTTDYAAGVARAHDGGGFDDWFLPSRDELNILYENKDEIGGFGSVYYWSSTNSGDNNAYAQYFNNGSQVTVPKSNQNYVRAVRYF